MEGKKLDGPGTGAGRSKDSYINSIFGFVVGDALGVPVEFLTRDRLKKNPVVDMIGFGSHKVPDGTWSDDTSMVLAEMDSIARIKKIDYSEMMKGFVSWVNEAEYTGTGEVFDIGITTRKSLSKYVSGVSPLIMSAIKNVRCNYYRTVPKCLPFLYFYV